MSNVKISDLTPGAALTGAELFEMTQTSNSRSTTAAAIVTLSNTWTADQEAAGFDIKDISNVEFRTTTGAPAGTVRAVYADAAGMNINALTATEVILRVAGTSEFSLSATQADFKTNNIIGVTDFTLLGNVNFPDGVRQTFNPDATTPGFNVGSQTDPNPTTPINGDIYYNSTNDVFRFRQGGAWIEIGSGAIATINGDGTAAQIMAAGTGLDIVDAGATHTYSIDATVATLTGAQTLTNKTIAAASNTLTIASTDLTDTANLVRNNAATTYTAGVRQDFLGLLAGTAGLNVGAIAGSPTTQVDGDLWYDSNTNTMFGRINGADVDLGQQSTEIFTWTANHDANGNALEDPLFADPTDVTKLFDLSLVGMTTGVTLTVATAQASSQTLTIPAITGADSLVTNTVAATLTNKTFNSGTSFTSAPTLAAGVKWVFSPNATNAGINLGTAAADPSSAAIGDIYYNTASNELRARIDTAWVDIAGPDTPWTVDHDFDRYSVLNAGSISWPIIDPRTKPAGTVPNIYFEEDPSIDHLRVNVPTSAELRIYVNDSERYSFSNTQFDPQQNAINNSGNITINTLSATGIITVGRSNEVVSQNAGEIRFRGGNDDYGQIEVEMTNTTNPTERGTMRFQVSANDILVDMITLTGSTSGSNSTISFNNRPMGSQINMNGFQIANALFISSNDANEADDGFLRMGADEYVTWRNNGDTNNNGITFNTADQIEFSIGNITSADYTFSSTVFDLINKRIEALLHIQDASQNEQLIFASVASAVNEITITNAATGNPALLTATGEANAALTIATSGTGVITLANDAVASGDLVMGDRFQGNKGPDVASMATITLGDGNFFDITGTTQIDAMTSTNWQAGSVVILHFDDALTVTHNTGADGFFLQGAASYVTTADDTLTVVWNGSRWEEISRSVN